MGIFAALIGKIPQVASAVKLGSTPEAITRNYEEYMNSNSIAVEATMAFLNSFFVQFFSNGYGLDVEVIDPTTKSAINSIADTPQRPRPNRMIVSLNEYYVLQDELTPYGKGTPSLKSAFFSTLPSALDAFFAEGAAVIGNYGEVVRAAAPLLTFISSPP